MLCKRMHTLVEGSGQHRDKSAAASSAVRQMMETGEFLLVVNGAEHTVRCEPDTPLLDVLRHDLGLAGPSFGCGLGLCGACFVLIDGRARPTCNLPVSAADGAVTTVEGLLSGGRLHPVQQAFLDEQAAQCGYCTAGMVMSAVDLLQRNPAPAAADVREALDGNLCRCGTHGRIVRAVLTAAGQTPARPGQRASCRPAAAPRRRPGRSRRAGGAAGQPAGQPGRQPGARPVARFRQRRPGHHQVGQGRVRPGHLDRSRAGGSRGTPGEPGQGAGGAGEHEHQPRRGNHGRQPVSPGLRLGAPAGLRAGP